MSERIRDAVWGIPIDPAGRKLVAIYMADLADEDGEFIVAVSHIADACNLSIEQTRRYIASLKRHGLITVTPRKREDGGQTKNAYKWNFAWEMKSTEDGR